MNGESVLLIDGDKDATSLLSDLLKGLGCDCRIEENEEEAWACLREDTVTLLIAEASLFQAEQIAELRKLRPQLPLILTGQWLERFVDHLDPRTSDFLAKPFTPQEAEFRIRRILLEQSAQLRNREAETELEQARDELGRKQRELELAEEDLERIKGLYQEIAGELTATSEKLRKAKDQLEVLARTDGLTEVYNHRLFMNLIGERFEAAAKQSTPLSLLMIDIDHFKTLNDRYGHMTGDLVLRNVAGILRSSCREEDIVARYGGEEFAVILPGTDSGDAQRVAERARIAIGTHPFPNGNEAIALTVSIGIGTIGAGVDSADKLISSADQALYRAKDAGRNRFVFGNRIHPPPTKQWFSRF